MRVGVEQKAWRLHHQKTNCRKKQAHNSSQKIHLEIEGRQGDLKDRGEVITSHKKKRPDVNPNYSENKKN